MKLLSNLKCLFIWALVGLTMLLSCKKNEVPYQDCAGIIACEYHLDNGRTFKCVIDQTNNLIENSTDSILFSIDKSLLSTAKFVFNSTDHAKIYNGETEIKSGDNINLSKEFALTVTYNNVTKAYRVKALVEKSDHSETAGALINPNMNATGLPAFNYYSAAKFNGMLYILGASYPEGPKTKIAAYELYKSVDGWKWEKVNTTPEVVAGFGTQLVAVGNTLFAVGGLKLWGKDIEGNPEETWSAKWRIFSTTDGINWKDCTQGQVNAPSARTFTEVTAHNGALIVRRGFSVMMGMFQGLNESLLYRSTDGTNWEKVTTSQTLAHARTAGLLFSLNNKLYLGSGYTNWFSTTGGKSDMWESEDNGNTWVKVADNIELLKRFGGKAISNNKKVYVLGGTGYDANKSQIGINTVIESVDGKTWTPLSAGYQLPGGFSQRIYPSVFIDSDSKFWIIGGLDEAKGSYGINNLDAAPRYDVWTKSIK